MTIEMKLADIADVNYVPVPIPRLAQHAIQRFYSVFNLGITCIPYSLRVPH